MDASTARQFHGVFPALITPFKADGSVDWEAYDRLVERQLAGGVAGVVPCGTTGESPTLTDDEKREAISRAVKICRGRAKVIAGTGTNCTADTVAYSKEACELGADALLVVVPYYNKPSQAGLLGHFKAVADAVTKPICLYNVPGRSVAALSAATVGELARHPNIFAIKEATGNLAILTEMRREVATKAPNKPFVFLTGDDPTLLPFLEAGGHGVISVVSNPLPKATVRLCKLSAEGRREEALPLFEALFPFMNALFVEANPVPCKTIMARGALCGDHVRLPLAALTAESAKKLEAAWNALPSDLRAEMGGK